MDAGLTQKNDQLLAILREEAMESPSSFLENENLLKALACCMISQWLNERSDDTE